MALNKGIWDPKLKGTNIKGTNLKSLIGINPGGFIVSGNSSAGTCESKCRLTSHTGFGEKSLGSRAHSSPTIFRIE